MATNLAAALYAAAHDFRSDTVTVPTMEMLSRMFSTATFADDIYSRDPTTVTLEKRIASLTGHEAAMFVPSGTMGNQVCLRTHLTQPPHSVLCDVRAHLYTNEAGMLAMVSQAMTTTLRPSNGMYLTLEEVRAGIVHEDVHYAPTRVVTLENTLHGVVLPFPEAKKIAEFIRTEYQGNIKLHLDGTNSIAR
jgi:threonine aldolase